MVVSGDDGDMEDNGGFLKCVDGDSWEAVHRGRACSACSGVGSPFAVPCGNRSMGGAGGGLEEVTVQVQLFLLLH